MIKIKVIGIVLLLVSCNQPGTSSSNKNFIQKFGKENFSEFKNTSMFIRSRDNEGIIIFAYDKNIPPDLNNGAYVITIDNEKKRIKQTSMHLMKDTSLGDKNKLEKLALKFIKYPIGYLGVDSNNTILISLKFNTVTDLVHFANIKYKTPIYKDWKEISDNWYEKN